MRLNGTGAKAKGRYRQNMRACSEVNQKVERSLHRREEGMIGIMVMTARRVLWGFVVKRSGQHGAAYQESSHSPLFVLIPKHKKHKKDEIVITKYFDMAIACGPASSIVPESVK